MSETTSGSFGGTNNAGLGNQGNSGSHQKTPNTQGSVAVSKESAPIPTGTERDSQGRFRGAQQATGSLPGEKSDGSGEASGRDAPTIQELEKKPGESSEEWVARLKIAGEEKEFDLRNPEHRKLILKAAQKSQGIEKKAFETLQKERKMEAILRFAQEQPGEFLRRMGHDTKKLAIEEVRRNMELENMDPRERRIMELEQERELTQREKQAHAQKQAEVVKQQLVEKHKVNWSNQIAGALQKSWLPPSEYTVGLVAQHLLRLKESGVKDATVDDVLPMVENHMAQMFKHIFTKSEIGALKERLGKDALDRIRQSDVEQIVDPLKNPFQKKEAPKVQVHESKRQYSQREWQEELERRVRG